MKTTLTKLRIGDEVVVVAGKDSGKKGPLRKIVKNKNQLIIVAIILTLVASIFYLL
mgnify:CR=1 FL=1